MKRKMVLSERQIINAIRKVVNEARRNPDTNLDEDFTSFYNRMLKKASVENIFVSFRDDMYVTDANPKNKYNTPTGFYTYPLASFEIPEKPSEIEFRGLFPFAKDRKYINFLILRSHGGILSHKTDKFTLDGYVKKIKELYSGAVDDICDSFINGAYKSDYNNSEYTDKIAHDTHLFWLFLYDIANATKGGDLQGRIRLICNAVGINGFVDYEDVGYIHKAESSQAVFFRVKNVGELFVYKKPKTNSIAIRNALQNREYEISQDLEDGSKTIIILDHYYGLMDSKGELISKKLFNYIGMYHNGYARVKLNNEWNLINKNGELLSPKQWFEFTSDLYDGYIIVQKDGVYNFINGKGELLYPKWFDAVHKFEEGFASVNIEGKGWNFITQEGNILSPDKWFNYVIDFNNGFAKVKLGDRWSFINKHGEILLPDNQFDEVYNFNEYGFAKIRSDRKWNFIGKDGNLLFPDQWFNSVSDFDDDYASVELGKGSNTTYNLLNKKGKLLSKDWFDSMADFEKGFVMVNLNDKFNFINDYGELLSPQQWFDDVYEVNNGTARVVVGSKYYYINKHGELFDENKELLTTK